MTYSYLRSTVFGLAAAVATIAVFTPTVAGADPATGKRVQDLADAYARANAALVRGDAAAWVELMPLATDFVLFSPFGGTPSRYADYTPERIERMGRFFRNGRHRQEIVQAFASDDMIVLATIERDTAEVGGQPAQEWALRVTSVFRRTDSGWKLAHRHADPLVEDISVPESARLARGERMMVQE